LEERGLIRAAWKETGTGRRAKVYSLTAEGRKQLIEQRATWERFSGAIAAILKRA
jgi:DNA-binding PadR family transcriptional regulator